jgi:hypothetical protein
MKLSATAFALGTDRAGALPGKEGSAVSIPEKGLIEIWFSGIPPICQFR